MKIWIDLVAIIFPTAYDAICHRRIPLSINMRLLDDLAGVVGKDRWDDLTTFKKGLAIFILFDLTVITGVVTYFVIVGII